MSPERAVTLILVLAVGGGWVRLAWWYTRVPVDARPRPWRIAALVVLQPVAAALLHATLLPPVRPGGAETLVVATAGAPRIVATGAGERLMALPEAGPVIGAARVPDLGSALREGGVARVRVVGGGLERRDRGSAAGVSVRFDRPASPRGITALTLPDPVLPGATFEVRARVEGAGAAVELVDPAGRIVDARPVTRSGSVVLSGTARGAGDALFALRLRGAGGIVERADVPVAVEAQPAARVLILAGAPGPEVKFLRRWAIDAGMAPRVGAQIGGGAALGDAPPPSAATLAQTDVLIVDDRHWADLGVGGRGAVAAAVRGGMGLVVRITGPVPRGWQVAGLSVAGRGATAPVVLPPAAPSDEALAARRGAGTRDRPASVAGARDAVPVLTRQAVAFSGAVPLLRDARGAALAAWRQSGRGGVSAITLHDSFALVTSGHGDRFADIWSTLVSAVARPRGGAAAAIEAMPRAGERVGICGAGEATVIAPGGAATRLLVDPVTPGCAGYWPTDAGWHRLTGPAQRAFFVHAAASLPGIRAAERADATRRLVGERPVIGVPVPGRRGSPWPWFAGWVAAVALLWWLERSRAGR